MRRYLFVFLLTARAFVGLAVFYPVECGIIAGCETMESAGITAAHGEGCEPADGSEDFEKGTAGALLAVLLILAV